MDIKLKLSIGACCLYEALTGKNFSKIQNDEDSLWMMYATYVYTNNLEITFDVFCNMLKSDKFSEALFKEFQNISEFNSQMKRLTSTDEPTQEADDETKDIKITDIATVLIVKCGLDANYVMNQMPLYQIDKYFEWYEKIDRQKQEKERLNTFFLLLPNAPKLKRPSDLYKFPWEEEAAKKDLMSKKDYIKSMFASFKAQNNTENTEEDGTGPDDTSTQQE